MINKLHVPPSLLVSWSESLTRFEDTFQLICEYYAKEGMCSKNAIYLIKNEYLQKLLDVENEISTIEQFTHDNLAFINRKAVEYVLIRHKASIDDMSARLAVCVDMLRKGEGVCNSVCLYKASQPVSG